MARFYAGTRARLEAVLRDGESLPEFVRRAVERELQYRSEQPFGETTEIASLSAFFRTGTFSDSDWVI